jgi:hypothetical protein
VFSEETQVAEGAGLGVLRHAGSGSYGGCDP